MSNCGPQFIISPCGVCNVCGNGPCTCSSPTVCCPEATPYNFSNANLAGVGVLGTIDPAQPLEIKFRGIVAGDDKIWVIYNGTTKTIELSLRMDKLLTQQVFTDAIARAAATPEYKGQLGTQRDNLSVWKASGTSVGQWEPIKEQQTFTNPAARNLATPVFLGQLGLQLSDGTLWRGTALSAGSWSAV